jgi:hypothetical protein
VQPIDRDRLRATLQTAADALSAMADQAIASKMPQLLPPQLRPLLPLMAGRLQTRSLLSSAVTGATNELSDDELWALWQLIEFEAAKIFRPDVIFPERPATDLPRVASAVAHLRALLAD